ncbi:hypothetical protein [Frisingicoccus sp.]|uniref:hypothetical protein n=1 Tax=Frisingicoccus sp. TaxID=1918627 RepID=UPI0015ABE27E
MKKIFETLVIYIFNNSLVVDKATYLTIVSGQITVYAILLTFYQFIVSFQSAGNIKVTKYLDTNLIEYYVKRRLTVYNRIISKPFFELFFVLEVLYKPIISIYSTEISIEVIAVLNFFWYLYVVIYFLVFAVLFFQCTSCILSLKAVIDVRRSSIIIKNINRDFKKKTVYERAKKSSIEMLSDDMECLRYIISKDDTAEIQSKYFELFKDIFCEYKMNKEKEVTLLLEKNKKVKNQVAWVHNMATECRLLGEFVREKNMQTNALFEQYILVFHLSILELNLRRAEVDGYEDINFDVFKLSENSLECREWKKLTEEIFEKCVPENQKKLIEALLQGYYSENQLFRKYCEEMLMYLIKKVLQEAVEREEQQKNFIYIFECIMFNDKFNNFYTDELCDALISYDRLNVMKLLKLVSKKNCTYIFVYLIIYYSIYRFRTDWVYIDVMMLRELWKKSESLESEFESINRHISNSHIAHRYSDSRFIALRKNIDEEVTEKWLEDIYQQEIIDAFYIIVIKLCVFEQHYYPHFQEGKIENKISFINELSKHKEVLIYNNVKEMTSKMRYMYFQKLRYWPENLDITLRSLLLMDISISDELIDNTIQYCHYISVGQYLLIKYGGVNSISEVKRGLIREAYVASDLSIQEYVECLYDESCICDMPLSYVRKEKMKKYLLELI